MTHKTKGIVLRAVKYGETSLVVTIFTELFGVQTYMINGVRTSKQASSKANYFQPAAILDLVVYHNEQKQIQRIKEFKWALLYQDVMSNVIKNNIALYMVELLQKCLKQPEKNPDLFYFCEDSLMQLDAADKKVSANFPLYFSLHLAGFFGFQINDDHDEVHHFLDLREGSFVAEQPSHLDFLNGEYAQVTAQLLKAMQPTELEEFKLNKETRRALLLHYQDYYAHHIQDFGKMKTLQVLQEVL